MHNRNAHAMRRAVLVFCAAILACALSRPVLAQAIDMAQDLSRSAGDAAAARVPLLVFFSQPGCPYCDLARQDYLGPMSADPAARKLHRMVEVDITSESPLVDFAGRTTTHRAFALTEKVRFVPVVKFLNARGEPLAPALIGLTVPGFYQSYLDRRIEQSLEKLAAPAK